MRGIATLFADTWVNLQQFAHPVLVLSLTGLATIIRVTADVPSGSLWAALKCTWRRLLDNGVYHIGLFFSVGVIIENVFSLRGVDQLTLSAIRHRDIPQLEANLLTFGLLMWGVWCLTCGLRIPASTAPALGKGLLRPLEPLSRPVRPIPIEALSALRRPSVVIPLVTLMVAGLLAIAAPFISPYKPLEFSTARSLIPPSFHHLLGTDELGRDILSRVLFALRPTLGATAAVALASCLTLLMYRRLIAG